MQAVKTAIDRLSPSPARQALSKAIHGEDLTRADIIALFKAEGDPFYALCSTALALRLAQASPFVTYVVNRNINFTNICYNQCRFCSFSRRATSRQAFFLDQEEIVRRAREALDLGATEVCIQAGLAPHLTPDFYPDLCRAILQTAPGLHLHAFSPQEIVFATTKSGLPLYDYIGALQQAGLGSLPGTSAEILDDEVRGRLSPARLTVQQWIAVIEAAHRCGLPTTATMMYGHVESYAHRADHLLLLRDLQRKTGGFTEFVPLRFIAPPGSTLAADCGRPDVIKTHAIARLALGKDIPNLQVSWVKEGLSTARACLQAGANDLGGTLIDEGISASAGAKNGQLLTPAQLRACIRKAGFVPAQRTTLYQTLRVFQDPAQDPVDRLDARELRATDPANSPKALNLG